MTMTVTATQESPSLILSVPPAPASKGPSPIAGQRGSNIRSSTCRTPHSTRRLFPSLSNFLILTSSESASIISSVEDYGASDRLEMLTYCHAVALDVWRRSSRRAGCEILDA